MTNKRKLLSIRNGKLRWKCEYCGAKVMCSPELSGIQSQCPHCKKEVSYPTLDDFDLNKQFKWKRLTLPILFSSFFALVIGLNEYSMNSSGNMVFPIRWLPSLSYSIGALLSYSAMAWLISFLVSKIYCKLNRGKIIYKRRLFALFLPVVTFIMAMVAMQPT